MKPIDNILPGSKVAVWIWHGGNMKELELTVTKTKKLDWAGTILDWTDVGATPREAVNIHISALRTEIIKCYSEIASCETILNRRYPIHPVLSEEEFAEKYPELPSHMRLEDCSPDELKELDSQEHWKSHRYDEPG